MHVQCYGFPHSKRPTYSKAIVHPRFSGTVPEIRFAYRTIFVPIFFLLLFFPFYSLFLIIFFRMETLESCWWLASRGWQQCCTWSSKQ